MIQVFGQSPLREKIKVDWMNFSAGESFFKMDSKESSYEIIWNYENDSEFFQLAQFIDFAKKQDPRCYINLFIPYFPHSRQDRYSGEGQPFSLKIAISFLELMLAEKEPDNFSYNSLSKFKIKTFDLHSDVGLSSKLCIINIKSHSLASRPEFADKYDFVVSPDKGAKQRSLEWACELDIPMLPCSKVRDPNTGKLKDPHVPKCDLQGKKVLIPDDICDGGFTFIQLAKILKERGATVDLYVSHGIFSRGIDCITQEIDHIYTTNSLNHFKKFLPSERLTVFEL